MVVSAHLIPKYCQTQDPESKGLVDKQSIYGKSDLLVPSVLTVGHFATAGSPERPYRLRRDQ